MAVPIDRQPQLILNQTGKVHETKNETAAQTVNIAEKTKISTFLSNYTTKLSNYFKNIVSSETSQTQETTGVSTAHVTAETTQIDGQASIVENQSQVIQDAIDTLVPLKLERSDHESLIQHVDENINALTTLNANGLDTMPEINLLMDIKQTLSESKVDDFMSWNKLVTQLDNVNSEMQRIQSGLSNTEVDSIYKHTGISMKSYVDAHQVKSVRDAQGMTSWLVQVGVATLIPGSLSNLKADQAHTVGLQNANLGNQKGSVQALFKNKPTSTENYSEQAISQTMSGTVKFATRMAFGLMDGLSGSAAYGAAKMMGYDTKSLAQIWNNRGQTRKLVAKKVYTMLGQCFTKLKGKVQDKTTKTSFQHMKNLGVLGEKTNQINPKNLTASNDTIKMLKVLSKLNDQGTPINKANIKQYIDNRHQFSDAQKNELKKSIDHLSDQEISTMAEVMQSPESKDALKTFEQLEKIHQINPEIHNNTINNLLNYINSAGENLDVTQIPAEQLAEVFHPTASESDQSQQIHSDYVTLQEFIKPRYGQSLDALLAITTKINVSKERHIRRIEKNIQKLETASPAESIVLCNRIEQSVSGLFNNLKEEKRVIPERIDHVNSKILACNQWSAALEGSRINLSRVDQDCTVSQIDESIDEVQSEIAKLQTSTKQVMEKLNAPSEMVKMFEDYIANPVAENMDMVMNFLNDSKEQVGQLSGHKQLTALVKLKEVLTSLQSLKSNKISIFEQEKKLSHTLIDVSLFKISFDKQVAQRVMLGNLSNEAILEDVEDVLEANKNMIAPENYALICQDIMNGMPGKFNAIKHQMVVESAFQTLSKHEPLNSHFSKELAYSIASYMQSPAYFDTNKVSESQLAELTDCINKTQDNELKAALETIKSTIETNRTAGILREKAWQTEMMHTGSGAVQMGVALGGGHGLGGAAIVADAAGKAVGLSSSTAWGVALGAQKYVTRFVGDSAVVAFSQGTNKANAPLLGVAENAVNSMEQIQHEIIQQLETELTQSKGQLHHKDAIEKELLLSYLKDKVKLDEIMLKKGERFEGMRNEIQELHAQGFN
ncbi:MAG: hypothetical protein VW397_04415, partial [Candidatus Margulisiibacteriota bacterium]